MSENVVRTSRQPLIDVKSGLYTAVVGALGSILTLFAIPVAPNVHINLYVFSGIMVGSTSGWFLGMLAAFIGGLYTPVLWGWFGAIPYTMILGASTGFFVQKFGLRPIIAALLGQIIAFPYNYWSAVTLLGQPFQLWVLGGVGMTTVQLIISAIITEALIRIPAIKKRLPKTEIHAPEWVARNPLLRHPWVEPSN